MRFKDKVIIVTGAGSGIGAATTTLLAREGATLSLADMNAETLDAQFRRLTPASPPHLRTVLDVSDEQQVEALVAATLGAFGRIDALINNAGIGILGRVTELSTQDWRRMFAVLVDAIYFASKYSIPHLVKTKGVIVNVGSISGMFGDHGLAGYDAAKGAVVNLTRAMAVDHGEDGIRVNAVCPGSVATPMSAPLLADARIAKHYAEAVPSGRSARPEEIADAIAFLASDQSSYVNGHCLVVDGALTASSGQPHFPRILSATA
jgi:meso-butanediol dehydrogenase / (S,S)-butanediol dehydrogenase / diacetyl reductase